MLVVGLVFQLECFVCRRKFEKSLLFPVEFSRDIYVGCQKCHRSLKLVSAQSFSKFVDAIPVLPPHLAIQGNSLQITVKHT